MRKADHSLLPFHFSWRSLHGTNWNDSSPIQANDNGDPLDLGESFPLLFLYTLFSLSFSSSVIKGEKNKIQKTKQKNMKFSKQKNCLPSRKFGCCRHTHTQRKRKKYIYSWMIEIRNYNLCWAKVAKVETGYRPCFPPRVLYCSCELLMLLFLLANVKSKSNQTTM